MMDRRMRSMAPKLTRALLAVVSVLFIAGPTQATAGPTGACSHAREDLARAKQKLAKLKRNDAPSKSIQRARRRVGNARRAVDKACGSAVFDVTGLDAKFDAHYTRDEEGAPCTFSNEAHWTASLAPGAFQERLEIYSRDKRGRPVYILSGPPRRDSVESAGKRPGHEDLQLSAPGFEWHRYVHLPGRKRWEPRRRQRSRSGVARPDNPQLVLRLLKLPVRHARQRRHLRLQR